MRWVVWLCALAGCGRFGFNPHGSDDDDQDVVDAAADAPRDAEPDGQAHVCAASYTLTVGASKVRVAGPATWLEAEHACEADGFGMHLIQIYNFTDQQKIEGFLDPAPAAWVGISDRKTDNTFLRVIGGLPSYLPWAMGEPNFTGPGCVILDPIARDYIDGDCNQSLMYVCECDLMPVDPTTF